MQGDVLRLFSAPLVHVTPLSLFITLAALGSIAVELEGLLGYWAFGLMAACVAVCGGLADALADTTPITQVRGSV
jgi:membrane associated rhomboid family serine protease